MPIIAMPILACVLGKYLMFLWFRALIGYRQATAVARLLSGDFVRRCIRLFLRQRIGSLFLTPPAVQQGLEHVDLTLQSSIRRTCCEISKSRRSLFCSLR